MIVIFTDFGLEGPYVGQMEAVLRGVAPTVAVVRLMSDAPAFSPRPAAYMLAALAPEFPAGTVFLSVVDPGVGGARLPCVLEAAERIFVGPGNGLFEIVARRGKAARWWEIVWRPGRLSASFHGRDLFAPVAARVSNGDFRGLETREGSVFARPDWPDDLPEVIYIDRFGNAVTGLRAAAVPLGATLKAGGLRIQRARTFGDVAEGTPLFYENSNGLIEIAVNAQRAERLLGLAVGSPVTVEAR